MSDAEGVVRRFLFEDLDIRGFLVQLGPAWQAMQRGRNYVPAVRDVLGELAAVGTLIGANLKTPSRLSFQVQGNGPISLLVVDCDERLRLRGMARTRSDIASQREAELFGDGRLVLTLQGEGDVQPYQSLVPLQGNSIAEIFEHYLAQSEQAPARLRLAADAERACGLFLQALPGAAERDSDGWNRLQHLMATVTPSELSLPAEELLRRLFPEETLRLFDAASVTYHCPRDEDRVRAMLASLGREEIESIVAEHGSVIVRDDICNHEYRFDAGIVDDLFGPAQRTLH